MRKSILFIFLLLLLFLPEMVCGAVVLQVQVSELAPALSANVLAKLRIYQRKDSQNLSEREVRRLHRRAADDIRRALEPLGYYASSVESTLEEREGIWQASYKITPGEPVRVRSLALQINGPGSGLPDFAGLQGEFPLQAGMVLHHGEYETGKRKLLHAVRQRGFVDAQLDRNEVRVHRGKREADIVLELNTGPRYYFGDIVSEQQVISEELLARFVPFAVGDPYSLREISRLQSILFASGFFSEVTLQPDFDHLEEYRVPIRLTAQPSTPNRYSFGLGYGTDTGIRGRMEWRNRLFNQHGHRVHTSLQLSEKQSRIGGTYEIPMWNPRYDTLRHIGSWSQEEWDATKTELLSVATAFNHEGEKHHYGASLELRDETYEVGVTSGSSLLLLPGINWSMIFAENRINTRDGWRVSADIKGAHESVVSDVSFLQGEAEIKGIISLWENWRVIGRGTAGTTLVDSVDSLPPSLRFYAGGDQSIRGFGYRTLGPKDASGTVIGGRYLLLGSAEIERRIDQLWSVAAFYDTGQAMDDINVDFKKSVGIGGRITLPFGQIRLDVAVPLLEEENSFRIHLNVGADL